MFGIYLIIGAFVGTLSGLFGIGGGILIVPALEAIFAHSTLIPPAYVMQMAIGTSLATMIFTSLSASISHHQRGAVDWGMLKTLLPTLLLGVFIGTLIATFLPSHFLRSFFGVFLAIIGLRMLLNILPKETKLAFSQKKARWLSGIIGALTSILGAGGGSMLVPFLLRQQMGMHAALGTSVTCSIFVSLVATLCFILIGMLSPIQVPMSMGYIYWPAFLGIALASVLFAPLGAALSHQLPSPWLKRIFAILLILISVDMLLFR